MKRTLNSELPYVIGMISMGIGNSMLAKADFGMSMVVAPAYVLHLKMSEIWSWFSFGVAEYCIQAVLLLATILVSRRFHRSYLFSFATAVLYGVILDAMMTLIGMIPSDTLGMRIPLFLVGMMFSSFGVANMFKTYIPPEVYELFVMAGTERSALSLGRFKTFYDCGSCVIAVVMSLVFFGGLVGVREGTVLCALINGSIIGFFSKWMDRHFEFVPRFPKAASFLTVKIN